MKPNRGAFLDRAWVAVSTSTERHGKPTRLNVQGTSPWEASSRIGWAHRMNELPPAPYLPTDRPDIVESTPLARAGWYPDGQHGGVVAALLGRAVEGVPSLAPMEVARLSVELFRVIPIAPLRVAASVVREGKRIQVVEASLRDLDDLELARAVALRLRTTELDLPPEAAPAASDFPDPHAITPPDMRNWGVGPLGEVLYHRHAVEVREFDGGFTTLGPGSMWMRLTHPLVAGEQLTPLTRATIVGDFVNGLSRLSDARRFIFMNADLTIHLHRPPSGEWVGVSAQSHWDRRGRGVATGNLFDAGSVIGRSTQTLFLDQT